MPKDVLLSEIEVKINGSTLPAAFQLDLLSVTVENSLHLPDVAELVLYDSSLKWLDDPRLDLGRPLQVILKAAQQQQTVFDGEIVEIEPEFDQQVQRLTVRAFDRMHRLSRGQHVRSFVNVSDADLVQRLAREAGLQAKVDPTPIVYPYVFQNNETNLSFLQRRAAALGYLLYVRGKTLYCTAAGHGQPNIPLEWGKSLHEFHPRLTTVEQVKTFSARGWDPMQKQAVMGQASSQSGTASPSIGQQKDGGAVTARAFALPETQVLIADRPIRTQALAEQLAKAAANKQSGSFVEAEGRCFGNPLLMAGASVQITKVGRRFSGTYFVTNTLHTYSADAGYRTQFSISGHQPSALLSLLVRPKQPKTMTGLVIGVVTDNHDPQGHGRVKVKYPWLTEEHASDWARLATPGAGAQRGLEFLPEVNDEVLVGFEMGDMECPYVLGGLWNGKDAPPEQVTSGGKVQKRLLRSRLGHTLMLDDSENGGGITIQDKNGNQIMLDTSTNALKITVKGDAAIQSQGNLTLKAQGNLTIEATGQVQLKGNGVTVDGGAGNTEIKGLNVNVKGIMINLN